MRIQLGALTVIWAFAAAGCPPADEPSCVLEDEVVAVLGGPAERDCGVLALDDGEAAYRAAHDCVAAALAAGESFAVLWDLQGIDSLVRTGYAGTAGPDAQIVRLWSDSDPSGGSMIGAVASAFSCTSFEDLGACDEPDADLCFSCASGPRLRHCAE